MLKNKGKSQLPQLKKLEKEEKIKNKVRRKKKRTSEGKSMK